MDVADRENKCKELRRYCPICERAFRRDERYVNCPDCGFDRRCGSFAVVGQDYCVNHGGRHSINDKVLSRKMRKNVKTGKNSNSQLTKLASKYLEMQNSGPIQSNRALLGVLDDRIVQLLARIEENYSPDRIKRLISAWEDLKNSFPGMKNWVRENKEAFKAYNTLDKEVEKAYHDYESWNQILDVFDSRRKTAVDEMRILKDMKALISAEDAYELAAQMLAAVVKVIGDEPNGSKLLALIRGEFALILGESHIRETGRREPEVIDIDTSGVDRI